MSVLPAYQAIPEYYKTFGGEVRDLSTAAGFPPDVQQEAALDMIFGVRSDGLSAAFEIALIVGRQNLKTAVFKMAALGWLYLFEERLVVWSAHEFSTAMEALRDMEELIVNSDFLRKATRRITHGNGSEAIETMTGARISFKTRTKGGGRGLSGRKIIFDEAFALHAFHMGALMPLLSAQPDPQLLYGSSAGLQDSDMLREIRDRGRAASEGKQAPGRLGYMEWCAPGPEAACQAGKSCTHAKTAEGCGCDKPRYWLLANPTLGDRISVEYVTSERQALPVEEFCRERMGWWDDPGEGSTPVSLDEWYVTADRKSTPDLTYPVALSVAVAPDSSMSAIGLAGWVPATDEEGNVTLRVHVEVVEYLPGTGWVMDRLFGIADRRKPCVTVVDPASAAGQFEKEMRNRGFITISPDKPLTVPEGKRLMMLPSARDYAQSCSAFASAVTNVLLRHPDQEPLNRAVQNGRSRPRAGGWVWDTGTGADVSPLIAVTQASLGLTVYGKKEPPRPFFIT